MDVLSSFLVVVCEVLVIEASETEVKGSNCLRLLRESKLRRGTVGDVEEVSGEEMVCEVLERESELRRGSGVEVGVIGSSAERTGARCGDIVARRASCDRFTYITKHHLIAVYPFWLSHEEVSLA